MSLLARWGSLRERKNRMNRELNRPGGPEEAFTTTTLAPPVEIYEDEQNIVLKIEAPGIDEKTLMSAFRTKPNRPRRAQDRKGRERVELPSRRTAMRKLYPLGHASQLRGSGTSERPL